MSQVVPAKFKYIAFFDLLADAVFHHQMAMNEINPYLCSRFARASIIASSLSVECFANCLLAISNSSRNLKNDLDKLPSLSKIDMALRLQGLSELDRGRVEVQRISELISARNDYVHPKVAEIDASIDVPQDTGSEWMVPIAMTAEHWKGIGIPKQSMLWSKEHSVSTLSAVCLFFRYIIIDLMKGDENLINKSLISRIEFGNILMPGVYDEFRDLLESASEFGLDFSFLGINKNDPECA